MPHSPLERLKIDDWNRTIDVNIKGVLYGIAAALPHMKQQKAGHIINVSSVAGHKVGPGSAVYSATKTAVRVLSEGLRQEVKLYNIRTTVISPGAVAYRAAEQHYGAGRRREYPAALRGVCDSCRVLRASRGVHDRPAGGGGHQRDSVPADAPGVVARARAKRRARGETNGTSQVCCRDPAALCCHSRICRCNGSAARGVAGKRDACT
jgi:NAD(P)-dependent dehydrogenase (short-subunit alcohol dehydrogenase family)